MVQGTGKADWHEVFSNGTDPAAQAGTREEVGKSGISVNLIDSGEKVNPLPFQSLELKLLPRILEEKPND